MTPGKSREQAPAEVSERRYADGRSGAAVLYRVIQQNRNNLIYRQFFTQNDYRLQLTFDLEPKQYRVSAGNRLGVLIASTDYEYTLRPKDGTTDFEKEVKSGAAVGVLVSLFVNTCHAWYATDLQATIKTWVPDFNQNSGNGDL